jgi:hypothetical protein
MLDELKKSWAAFKKGSPGERFESFHRERKKSGGTSRFVFTVLGVVLLAGGVVLLFIPGPGFLLIAFGGALLAQQSLWLARLLDKSELISRKIARRAKDLWKKASIPVRVALVTSGLGLAAGAAWLAYLWLFKR